MNQAKRIALLIDTATSWGQGLIEGIASFARDHERNWLFSIEPRGKYDRMLLPPTWRGSGVIARLTHADLANQLISLKIPAVNVSWYSLGASVIPRCTCDEQAAGKLAADYLLGQGYRQFAYCGSTLRTNYHDRFGEAFRSALANRGRECRSFQPEPAEFAQLDSEAQLRRLSDWLVELPRPLAVLAFDDIQGRQITEACAQAGLLVPQDIAVLGGEHDQLSSRISSPELSGIDQDPLEVGYHAAEMLDQLLRGEPLKQFNQMLPPRRVVARRSTDKIALPDDMLSMAVRYIREHAGENFQIEDLLAEVPISRRAMELGFRKHLGRSPREEIRRARIERAVQLLCDTDWPVTRIASACGFDRPELLTRAFRRELDTTPSKFRKRGGRPAHTQSECDA
ncbi:Xylose operon regulatory protein [Posidoniimonas polymericola]|uniref:Xylose operon regulatory protein n=1 Tax=Posidoniimonas polymericola TaxID=2528002 RepID=A0A5C5YM57_9BACT|nr:DNA-binding transcriptional regulator [Posidoniimonas polymericola]TWT76051.1 Xylose operon regulatory protein [Posidoniimonas polymericola]